MEVLIPGHRYQVPNFENPQGGQTIQFIQKEPNAADPTQLDTVNDGTTNEALLEVLINRTEYLQAKFPCAENEHALQSLKESFWWFNERTNRRKAKGVEGKQVAH